MKKIIKTLLCITIISALAMGVMLTVSANEDITVILDGTELTFDQNPVIVEGRTLVPLRGIFEAMGAEVLWDEAARCVTATKADTQIKLTIGENILYKNEEAITFDVPAQIVNSRTLVPARAVSESFGARVGWNSGKKYVVISTDSVLNKMLEKAYATDEYVLSSKIEMSVSGIPANVNARVGIDFENEKAFAEYTASAFLFKITSAVVNGEGKTYIEENGNVSVTDADNVAVRGEKFYDEFVFEFSSQTALSMIYDVAVDVNGAMINLKVYVDKSSSEPEKIVVPLESAKLIDKSVASDVEIDVVLNSGEVIKMWNKYHK